MPKPIAILGGTFDPIHLGHIHLANNALQELELAAVHLVPCNTPVHRRTPIATAEQRFDMVQFAVADQHGLIADDIELKRGGSSYMIDTFQRMKEEHPKTPLILLLSSDAFIHFMSWKNWQEFLDIGHIVVANRVDYDFSQDDELMAYVTRHQTKNKHLLHNTQHGKIFLIQINPLPLSGTEIRQQLSQTNQENQFVTPAVWQYINDHQLYKQVSQG